MMNDDTQADPYRDAVKHATKVDRSWYEGEIHTIFVDPEKLIGSHAEKIEIIKEMFQEQYPKFAATMTDDDAKQVLQLSSSHGPAAAAFQFSYKSSIHNTNTKHPTLHRESACLVFEPSGKFDRKEEFVSALSDTPIEQLKDIPGDNAVWQELIGTHEGTHCDKAFLPLNALEEETRADLKTIEILKENGHDDVARAFMDYRILRAASGGDADHATGLALEAGGEIEDTDKYAEAANTFGQLMDEKVITAYNIPREMLDDVREQAPEDYIKAIEQALENGEFRDPENEYIEQNVRAYIGAFRRQVQDVLPPSAAQEPQNDIQSGQTLDEPLVSPLPEINLSDINGGQPMVDLTSNDRASMTIGDVSPSDFFASVAHPELAAEKIAMQEMAMQNANDFSFLPEQQVTNSHMALT